jgi:hypothetical protein
METYYTKVSVQADRWVASSEALGNDKPTIIIENEEVDANDGWVKSSDATSKVRYRLDEDCSCG